MATSRADLITHPMRARIIAALMGRQLTTQQMAELLPDIPLPSLYRHVRLLVEAGVLKAVEEVRVHGALMKVYALQEGGGRLQPQDVADADRADRLRHFTTFLNTLLESYRLKLEQNDPEPGADFLNCLVEPLYLRPEETKGFVEALQAFLEPWRAHPSAPDRRRLLFARILFQDKPDPPLT
ncbi:MAG TPA: helix-turn-helix domain-containing protein [Chthonomonadaceae bacterium]|nr:helix-turn-helix domain-containing protein [Chthonomonadaceae bacterium]